MERTPSGPWSKIQPRRSGSLLVAAILLGALLTMTVGAGATVPDRFTFQGILETDGALLTGSADLSFAIYADSIGGAPVWTQAVGETSVRDGLYSVQLGPFQDSAFSDPAWLEVIVDGTPLLPRYRLQSVPFAFRAAVADHAAPGSVDGESVQDGSLTAADLATDVISTIDGVANDAGNVDLVAGPNVTIVPDDAANTITISATMEGVVTGIVAGEGLVGSERSVPMVNLRVGAGDGIAVSEDAVAVDATALAGDGLQADGSNNLSVRSGTGLQVVEGRLQFTPAYADGSAMDSRFVNEGQVNAVTAEMIAPAVVSSVAGVENDGGDIGLVAGPNVTITPDAGSHRITISALGSGDVTDVIGSGGLVVTNADGPSVALSVGPGDGIQVSASEVSVDAAALAGQGLQVDASNNLAVNVGVGLILNSGLVRLEPDQLDGSAHDARFVNEGQSAAITAGMIAPSIVSSINGVSNHAGDIDIVSGFAVNVSASDAANTITVGVDASTFAGLGLQSGEDGTIRVATNTGLEISDDSVQLTAPYSTGSVYDGRFVNEAQANSITADMITPNVVGSVDGVTNDAGDIDLVGGHGVTVAPSDPANAITFTVDSSTLAGAGLGVDGSSNFQVTTGTGLEISDDAVRLTAAYSTGSAYDSRFVNEEGAGTIPIGGIIMWSGSVGSIPTGWALCDGSTVNGRTTPDLRGRFVLPAGSGSGLTPRGVGETGGEETHTLSANEMPSHNHSVDDPGHAHSYTNPLIGNYQGLNHDENGSAVEYPYENWGTTASSMTGISLGNTGSSWAHNNMPPFYVLAFIMRVQ